MSDQELWPPCHQLNNVGMLHPSAKPPCNGQRCGLCTKGTFPIHIVKQRDPETREVSIHIESSPAPSELDIERAAFNVLHKQYVDSQEEIRQLKIDLGIAQGKLKKIDERKFPIMGGPDIPWSSIAPYEKQAQLNHGGQDTRTIGRAWWTECERGTSCFIATAMV